MRQTSTILLTLFCMVAFGQSTGNTQQPLNEFSSMEGTSVLRYNFTRERNMESRAGHFSRDMESKQLHYTE